MVHAVGWTGNAHRSDGRPDRVANGCGDGHHAEFELLAVLGKANVPDSFELGRQRLAGHDGVFGLATGFPALEYLLERGFFEEREQYFPGAGAVCIVATAEFSEQAHGVRAIETFDVDNLAAIEHADLDRLARCVAQIGHWKQHGLVQGAL